MPTWVSILIGLIIITTLIALFIISYILNKRTPVPEGYTDVLSDCEGCRITSCTLHKPTSDKVEVI